MNDNGKVSNALQTAYVRRYTLTDGNEAGLKVIEIVAGALRLLLNESKALDVMQLWHKGDNISFVSKNGFSVRETEFSRRFEGGMVYTCGLDGVGARDGCELHGSFHNSPARVTRLECKDGTATVCAEIRDAALFGKNLVLRRTVTVCGDSNSVRLDDVLSNEGTREENYCLLYHVNLGYPMLDEGVKMSSDEIEVTPRTDYAKKHIDRRTVFPAPIPGEEERCYFINHRTPLFTVTNDKLGKVFSLRYSADTLPCFVQWISPASQDYALGAEPSTTFLDDAFAYRKIAPAEQIRFFIELSIE